MNNRRFQHLGDAFNSIITMMLAEIRARGLRSLLDLPKLILLGLYLRRLGKEFAALIASLDAGALPPLKSPAATPPAAPPGQPAASASADRAQPSRAISASAAGTTRATRMRPAAVVHFAPPVPTAPEAAARRTRGPQPPHPPNVLRLTPFPRAIVGLSAGLLGTGRS